MESRLSRSMTYIDMFVTGSSFNEMDYSNPKYDELVAKSKENY